MRAPRPATRRSIGLVLSSLLLLAGCGDDDGTDVASSTSASTSTPTSETSASTSTTSTIAAGCPAGPEPTGAARGGPVSLDADGDGADDQVVLHVAEPSTLEVVVDYAPGGRTVATFDDDTVATFADIRVAAVHDVDADGDDDLWLVVGAGASVEVVSLVLAEGCDLVRPTVGDRPNAFTAGASIGFVSGVECVDGGFLEHRGELAGDSTYEGTTTEWSVTEASLERAGEERFEIDLAAGDQSRYTSLDCR